MKNLLLTLVLLLSQTGPALHAQPATSLIPYSFLHADSLRRTMHFWEEQFIQKSLLPSLAQRPTTIRKRIIAATSNLDSVRYYYSGIRGSRFPTSWHNVEAWHAPFYTPNTSDKYIAYDSAAKWHRHHLLPDTALTKRRSYNNKYNAQGLVTYIHNPSFTKNEMVEAPFSQGQKYVDISYNTSGLPLQYDYYYDTSWAFDNIYGFYFGNEQYRYHGRHNITYNNNLPQTDIFRINKNGNLSNSNRITYHYNAAGLYDSVVTAKWDTLWTSDTTFIMDWIDTAKSFYIQGINGSFIMEHFVLSSPFWEPNSKMIVDYDNLGREINKETFLYNTTAHQYATLNKETRTYNGTQLTWASDSFFLGYEAYLSSGMTYSSTLFTGPSVWVPYLASAYYTNSAGAIDSFLDVRNFSADGASSLNGWVPTRRAIMTQNNDNLTTSYTLWYNYMQSPNWMLASVFRYYYEDYDDAPVSVSNRQAVPNKTRFYPNPVFDKLTLQWDAVYNQRLTVSITDITGKPALVLDDVESGTRINVASLPAGIYFVTLAAQSGRYFIETHTLVKQ